PKYVPAGHPLFEKTDAQIETEFISALEKMYPNFSRKQISAFNVCRTQLVMAIPTREYSQSLPSQKTSVDGMYLVNSSYILKGNLNVNETIEIAENAYRELISKDSAIEFAENQNK
ncbi:MAG: FAD-dependent oxidoreductase, partial [Planctomycetota bacterium]